jgi:hypothetical protein
MVIADFRRNDLIPGIACKQRHDDPSAAEAEIEKSCSAYDLHSRNEVDLRAHIFLVQFPSSQFHSVQHN